MLVHVCVICNYTLFVLLYVCVCEGGREGDCTGGGGGGGIGLMLY